MLLIQLKKNLELMAGKVDEAHQFLLKMEELEDTRVIEISQLQLDNEKLVRELQTARDMNSVLETRESASRNALHEASNIFKPVNSCSDENNVIITHILRKVLITIFSWINKKNCSSRIINILMHLVRVFFSIRFFFFYNFFLVAGE